MLEIPAPVEDADRTLSKPLTDGLSVTEPRPEDRDALLLTGGGPGGGGGSGIPGSHPLLRDDDNGSGVMLALTDADGPSRPISPVDAALLDPGGTSSEIWVG